MIKIDKLKQLREETAVSVQECRKALEETKGDLEKAKELLKKWGRDLAHKKSSRETNQGIIESYLHPNRKIGVLLELDCETDFVAKSDDFRNLAHELCLQIAASREETPLSEQPWIKEPQKTIGDLVREHIAKLGENVIIKKFERYEI
jgi:elongation factor Ts